MALSRRTYGSKSNRRLKSSAHHWHRWSEGVNSFYLGLFVFSAFGIRVKFRRGASTRGLAGVSRLIRSVFCTRLLSCLSCRSCAALVAFLLRQLRALAASVYSPGLVVFIVGFSAVGVRPRPPFLHPTASTVVYSASTVGVE